MRFMITDNTIYPKCYEITKVMDTFPLGTTKIVLSQSHFNEHTDLCGVDEEFFGDKEIHMVCDFYKSSIKPVNPSDPTPTTWTLSEVNDKLYVGGSPQVVQAIPSEETTETCTWKILLDDEPYEFANLVEYLDITPSSDNRTLTITAISKILANYIITVEVYDSAGTLCDSVEMEVSI